MKRKTVITFIVSMVALFIAIKVGQFFLNTFMFSHHSMGGFRHHGGPRWGHHGFPGDAFNSYIYVSAGWVLPVLFQLAILIVGFVMLKTAKNNGSKKWLGIVILAIGMILLLPKVILIPLTILIAYMVYRRKSKNTDLHFSYEQAGQPIATNADFLDSWEKKTKMED